MFDQMMEMGFAESLVLAALKQTDNNMVQALNMIETEPELLVDASQTEMQTRSGAVASAVVTDQVWGFAGLVPSTNAQLLTLPPWQHCH